MLFGLDKKNDNEEIKIILKRNFWISLEISIFRGIDRNSCIY